MKKEDVFNFYEPGIVQGFKHSGIITDCYVRADLENIFYYTGDTDGRFCLWSLVEQSSEDYLIFILNAALQ